jgi:hypothetical protein
MQDAATYHRFAQECRRMARTASEKDKAVLIKIAEAWEAQAQEAERRADKGKL